MIFSKLKEAVISKPYAYYFIVFFLGYISLNFFVNNLSNTYILLFYTLTGKITLTLILITGLLVATSLNLVIIKFKEIRQFNKAEGFTAFGIFGGLMGGACPACFVGLFPAFLGLFGVTASLTDLPFKGVELQIGSIVLLVVSIVLLSKPSVCNPKISWT